MSCINAYSDLESSLPAGIALKTLHSDRNWWLLQTDKIWFFGQCPFAHRNFGLKAFQYIGNLVCVVTSASFTFIFERWTSFTCFIFWKVPASHCQKKPSSQTFWKETWHESQEELGKPGLGTCLIALRSDGAWPLQVSFWSDSLFFFLLLQIADVNHSNAHLNVQLSHEKYICQKRDWILSFCLFVFEY